MCEKLEPTQGTEPVTSVQDIIDIVRDAMGALQPEYPTSKKQLVFDELDTVLTFFGVDSTN